MGLRDVLFSLKLKNDGFNSAMEKTRASIRKTARERMDGIRKQVEELSKDAGKNATKIKKLSAEYKHWAKTAENAAERVAKSVKRANASAERSGGGGLLGSLKAGVGMGIGLGAFQGVTRVLGRGMTVMFSDSISAAVESRQVQANLANSLKNAGQGGGWLGAMEKQAGRVMRAFNIDDEEVLKGFAVMIDGGMKAADALAQTGLVADIAAKKKISFADASAVVSRVFNGELRALKQMNVFVAETGNKQVDAVRGMEKLRELTQGAAGEQAALASPWEAIRVSIGEIIESLGGKLLPAISAPLRKAADFLNAFMQTEGFEKLLSGLAEKVEGLLKWGLALANTFDMEAIGDSVMMIAREAGGMLVELLGVAGGVIAEKMREAIPGLGKSAEQRGLDAAWAKYGGMGRDVQASKLGEMDNQLAANPAFFQRNKLLHDRQALKLVMGGTRQFAASGVNEIVARRTAALRGATVGAIGGQFDALASAGERQRAAEGAALSAGAGAAMLPGYSARAAQVEAEKRERSGKKGLTKDSLGRPLRIQIAAAQPFNPVMALQ